MFTLLVVLFVFIVYGNIHCQMVLNRGGFKSFFTTDYYQGVQNCDGFGTAIALTPLKQICYCKSTSPIFYEIEPGFYCSSFDSIKRKEGMNTIYLVILLFLFQLCRVEEYFFR